jgi:pantoate--beta-alanine ligase
MTGILTVDRIADVRAVCDDARGRGQRVGLVPTMGAFHAGHRSLMRAARSGSGLVVVSLFVNPTQFGPNEDLAAYPRDLEGDRAAAEAEGVDVLFAPPVEEMYPTPPHTTVRVDGLTERLCGASRPTHFDGVTTVCTKLFSIVGPCSAYFGRKDAQQLAVVRRMVRDLDLPVDVVACPLVREPDGVAMSSRNQYLAGDERRSATVLSRALRRVADDVRAGERNADALQRVLVETIDGEPLVTLEYAEVVDAATLEPVSEIRGEVLVAVAAHVGRARLIDNCTVSVSDNDEVAVDLGVSADTSA